MNAADPTPDVPTSPRIDRAADGRLRFVPANGAGDAVEGVRLHLAWPLRARDGYIVVLDKEGREVHVAESIRDLDPSCHALIREELAERYFTSRITAIRGMRVEHVVSYWDVDTDRGPREFVIEESEHNPRRITPQRWLVEDVSGNRFVMEDIEGLDRRSRRFLHRLLD